MNDPKLGSPSPYYVWITAGAALFMVALTGSALVVPQLRVLHFFQALIYVAVILLARHNNPWGLGAGVSVAVFWNSLQIFVTHLMWAGLAAFWSFLHTGQARRIETMMVTLGGIGHFILIVACLAAFLHTASKSRKWWRFAGGGVMGLAYLAIIVSLFLPRGH